MSALFDIIKGIFIPAIIALGLYLLFAYAIFPFVRAHRQRYSQYLPLETLTGQTSSIRSRIGDFFGRNLLPPSMRWPRDIGEVNGTRYSEDVFGDEEGESMVGFDVNRTDREVRGGRVEIDSQRRLNRDLEEGFKDDSEGEEGGNTTDPVFGRQRR
nr:hypothetical protein CFP56_28485 [Quercus suber]